MVFSGWDWRGPLYLSMGWHWHRIEWDKVSATGMGDTVVALRICRAYMKWNRCNYIFVQSNGWECEAMAGISNANVCLNLGWIWEWSKALAIIGIVVVGGGIVVAIVEYIKSKLYSVTLYSHAWRRQRSRLHTDAVRVVEQRKAIAHCNISICFGSHSIRVLSVHTPPPVAMGYELRPKVQIANLLECAIIWQFCNCIRTIYKCSLALFEVLRIIRSRIGWTFVSVRKRVIYVTCWKEALIIKWGICCWTMPVEWS